MLLNILFEQKIEHECQLLRTQAVKNAADDVYSQNIDELNVDIQKSDVNREARRGKDHQEIEESQGSNYEAEGGESDQDSEQAEQDQAQDFDQDIQSRMEEEEESILKEVEESA